MVSHLSLPLLLLVFTVAAAAVWIAGIGLSSTTDVLSKRLHLGEALGGLLLLAITTNLPEIAITASAAWHHSLDIAVGNILGGIAIQTVVLAVLDGFGVRGKNPLTYMAASLVLVLEGILVVAVLVAAIMGTQLPASLIAARVTPEDVLIVLLWVVGLWLVSKARTNLPWHENGSAPGKDEGADKDEKAGKDEASTGRTVLVFAAASLVTLVAGVVLEASGEGIARHLHMTGVLFGATILAAATALPEVSTGLASIKLGDYQLAVSDIFGGNAFLPVLFLMATVVSGKAVLPSAGKADIYLAALGILLTTVYIVGLIFRPQKRIARLGRDSLVVVVLYLVGMGGLVAIARAG